MEIEYRWKGDDRTGKWNAVVESEDFYDVAAKAALRSDFIERVSFTIGDGAQPAKLQYRRVKK